jgi:thioredoxin-like negative regulator of GroEL
MRKIFVIILCCVAVLLAGYAGYRAYKVGKRSHLISMARQFLDKSDGKNAQLCVQQVLRSDPRHLEATRLMAELAEAARLPSAMLWRSRVVELNPKSLDDRLALAQTAITMRDYATATNALEGVVPADNKTASYHNIAGAVAIAGNQPADAKAHFLEVCRLEPQNASAQLNLAVVRLHGTNASELTQARAVLDQLCSNPTNSALRCQALRELAVYAMRNKQEETALALSARLLRETNSVFADQLLRLSLLQPTRNAEFKTALTNCQHAAAGDPGKIQQLATWQMVKTSPGDALAWLRSLPKTTQTNQPVALLAAECFTLQQDWRGLKQWLDPQSWGELDFLRHGFLSRALRGVQLADSAKMEWEQAMRGASGQKQSLVMLFRLVAQWNWVSEGEEVLWAIVKRYPDERWAVKGLTQALIAGGRTRSLMQLNSQILGRTPADLSAKNNLAILALLLDAKELKPYDLAKDVYQKSPTNAAFASTYAFSLHLQGKNADALKIMEQIKPQDLQDPSNAGYYGVILKATGNREKAKAYLNWSAKGHLLPEEQKLFEKAKAGL